MISSDEFSRWEVEHTTAARTPIVTPALAQHCEMVHWRTCGSRGETRHFQIAKNLLTNSFWICRAPDSMIFQSDIYLRGIIKMRVRCACGWEKDVKDEHRGKQAECPKCHAVFVLEPVSPRQKAELISAPHSLAEYEDDEPQAITTTPRMRAPAPQVGAATHYHPPAVNVHVQQPSGAAHSLGLASMVMGILGLMICWVPVLGLLSTPLSGIGLLLGVIGGIVALTRSGHGIGFPIAGSTICGLALMICVTINVMLFGAASATVAAVDDSLKKADERRQQRQQDLDKFNRELTENPLFAPPVQHTMDGEQVDQPVTTITDEKPAMVDGRPLPSFANATPENTAKPDPPSAEELAESNEKAAESALKLGRAMLRKNESAGRKRIQEVIEKWPETQAAKEAAKLID